MTHPLLTRLMRRLGVGVDRAPPDVATWAAFVEHVDQALNEADSDRRVLERSLRISSEEMRELYEEAQRSSATALAAERDKLAKSVASLQATLAAADDGILFVDEHRRFANYNARFVEMWKLPPALVGAGDDEAAIHHVLGMVQDPAAWGARVQACYADPSLTGHDQFELLDGRVFERYTAPVQLADGAIVGRVWFFRDATSVRRTLEALRSANRFLDSVVENIPDMVFVKDARDLRFVRFNRAGEDLLGLRQEALLGHSDADLFPPDEAAFFLAKDREVLARGELVSIEEEQITTRTGETRILSTKKIPIADDEGQPLYLLGISRDITRAKHDQQELRAAKDAAEAAARAKADFLANMSHELRTPLNAILGFSRILGRSSSLSSSEREHARFLVTAAEHMLALVNDLLDLRRLEARVVTCEALELAPILEGAAALVRPLAEERAQTLVVQSSAVRVVGEPMTLTQVLLNLLSNAVKFTPPGGTIRLVAEPRGAVVRLSVEDDGEGIAPSDQPRVFDYFQQAGGKHAHRMKGSGIGLALTRKLVEALGSSIELTSAVGVGSTFAFELRLADGASLATAATRAGASS